MQTNQVVPYACTCESLNLIGNVSKAEVIDATRTYVDQAVQHLFGLDSHGCALRFC